ncbi:MAG: DUF6498-containing protein [Woeseiaceae bacterium]
MRGFFLLTGIRLYIAVMNPSEKAGWRKSVVSLIGANMISIVLALKEGWNLQDLMIIYWAQSVIIGIFSAKRMLALSNFTTVGMWQNGKPVPMTPKTKRSMAGFFAMHYGGFHFVYLVFILSNERNAFDGNLFFLTLCVLVFLVNHYISFTEYREQDAIRTPNIGNIMFFPYLRIVPMHLTIILGGAFTGAGTGMLLFFLILKTLADVLMHRIEHSAALR